jgi:cytidylate kinase
MAIVTITRGQHSGGEEVAQAVADKLGARCVSLEVLREAARKYGVPEDKVEGVFEKPPSFWERMTESRRIYVAYVQAMLAEWARGDNLVYHGNAGQELLRDAPHTLKVRLMYPVEARIHTIMARFKYTHDQASRYVEQIDEERTKRTRYLYNVDWRDSRRYDITLNVDRITSQIATETILALTKQPEFTLTEAKAVAFSDFLVKTRVYALLAGSLVGRLSLITVTVSNGVVKLEGTLTSNEDVVEDMVDRVRALEGVKSVDNQIIVGLVYQEWNV